MNSVYVGMSLDGYIADSNGELRFLESVPNPNGDDFGYHEFMMRVDALVMGRVTFEKVLSFGIDWPYEKPVFVLSTTLEELPEELAGKVELVSGNLAELVDTLTERGHENLYIDGGQVVNHFLQADLVDELILTRLPLVLGGGTSIFGSLPQPLAFELVKSEIYLGEITQSHYRRAR